MKENHSIFIKVESRFAWSCSFTYIRSLIQNGVWLKKSYKQTKSNEMQAKESVIAYRQSVYKLTDREQKLIMRSEEDIKAGRIYTQTDIDKMADGINDSPAKESINPQILFAAKNLADLCKRHAHSGSKLSGRDSFHTEQIMYF